MSAATITSLLDAAFTAYADGDRVHITLQGDDAVLALKTWAEAQGLDIDESDCIGVHPNGEQKWIMVRALFDGDEIVTAHSKPVVTATSAQRPGGAS